MAADPSMRLAFALPGFHKVDRGAEVALLAVAQNLALRGHAVTVFGSGQARSGTAGASDVRPCETRRWRASKARFGKFICWN